VQDRKQFGRPLSAFQVIQHGLAIAAEEVAAATTITDLCVARSRTNGNAEQFSSLLQAAAIVCNDASTVVYDTTHQVHGAIGFTREYALHRHTINLLRWQDDLAALLGSNIQCAQRLGAQAVSHGGVWKTVTQLMSH
jgi:alkylation response protein AidB-like acyl-CoA dehydrogenase